MAGTSLLQNGVFEAGSAEDLRWVAEADAREYGSETIDLSGMEGWWRRYEPGIHLLRLDSRIVAEFEIWPISAATYKKIVRGEMFETGLTPRHIVRVTDGRPHSHWYVGDVLVDPSLRGGPAVKLLLGSALARWIASGHVAERLRVCAFGSTEKGRDLLKRLGFGASHRLPPGYTGPVPFERRISRSEAEVILHRAVLPAAHAAAGTPPFRGKGFATEFEPDDAPADRDARHAWVPFASAVAVIAVAASIMGLMVDTPQVLSWIHAWLSALGN